MYNEGTLHGMWLTLPCTDEVLQSTLDEIGIDKQYEEYFITDYENDLGLRVDEYTNLSLLNEVAICISRLCPHELQTLKAVIELESSDISSIIEVIENLDKYTLHEDIKTYHDLGHYLIHDAGDFNTYTVETLEPYLDYESFGYTYDCNSDGGLSSYGWLEQLINITIERFDFMGMNGLYIGGIDSTGISKLVEKHVSEYFSGYRLDEGQSMFQEGNIFYFEEVKEIIPTKYHQFITDVDKFGGLSGCITLESGEEHIVSVMMCECGAYIYFLFTQEPDEGGIERAVIIKDFITA